MTPAEKAVVRRFVSFVEDNMDSTHLDLAQLLEKEQEFYTEEGEDE